MSIHGPLVGRVIRLDTVIRLKSGDTLADLLVEAGRQGGMDLRGIIREERARPVVMLHGESLTMPDDLERPLTDGDEVVILQALAGG
jgi:molybdopterin converting factor small subunit